MINKRPRTLLKIFFKLPIFLHKIGLGGWERLIGAHWMLLKTTGRKTGKPRETMVDIMDHDKANDTYYIEAAYGSRSDWYKNIQATPIFEAKVGRRKFNASARELNKNETAEKLIEFFRRNPVYTRIVMAMVGMKFKDEKELKEIGSTLTLLAVTPRYPDRSSN